jgi:phage-related protein
MASKVEIDIPGIGLIEAKNAASEETLLEILKELQKNQKELAKVNKGISGLGKSGANSGVGAAAGAGAAMGASLASAGKAAKTLGGSLGVAGKAAGLAGKALGSAGKGAGFLVGAFSTVVGASAKVVGSLSNLGSQAINVANDLASMGDSVSGAAGTVNKAFSSLPGVFGKVGALVGSTFAAVAGSAERLVGAYQTAASVGATFGGSLNSLTAAASGAGMEMNKFAALIAQNAQSMMYLGGTTESGARRFAELSKQIRTSQVGAELLRMGFSTEQVNNGMAQYIGLIGRTGAIQNMTTQQIAKSSAAYLKDLDALRRLTGESAEQQKAANDKLMADAQFRAAMLSKDAETQKAMMAYINSLPEELRDGAKEMIATGQVTSDAGMKFAAVLPQAANQAMALGRDLKAGGKMSMDTALRARQDLISEAKIRQNTLKDQALYNQELQGTMLGVMNAASSSSKSYAELQREQAQAAKEANQAQQLEQFKQRIAEVSNAFTSMLANSGMLDMLLKSFEGLVSIISTYVVPVVKGVFSLIQSILPPVVNAVVGAFQALWPIVSSIASFMIGMLSPALDGVSRIFGSLNTTTGGLTASIENIVDSIFPIFNAAFRGLIMAGEGLMKGLNYLIQPVMRLVGSIANLFGGTEGLKNIFLTVGNIVGTTFEYIGVVGGIVIDIFSSLIDAFSAGISTIMNLFGGIGRLVDLFENLIRKSSFLSSILDSVGKGFEYLKMLLSPAGLQVIFVGLKNVVANITDFVGNIIDGFKEILAAIYGAVGKLVPSFKTKAEELNKEVAESREARKEAADQRKEDLKNSVDHMKTENASKQNKVENEKKAIEQDERAYKDRKDQIKRLGVLSKAEEDAKKAEVAKAAGPEDVDMSSPMAMLESFSRQQGGFFAERIDKARKEQVIVKEQKAIEEQAAQVYAKMQNAKTDAEKEAAKAEMDALKQRMKAFEEMVSGVKPTAPTAGVPSPAMAPMQLPKGSQITGLGAVAAHFEAGGKAGTVSTGHGDFGGKSYGAFQLSSKTGDLEKFLEKSGYAKQFEGMEVGSKEFDAKWKELGASKEFAQAQAAHAKTTHYDPQMKKLEKSGLDMSGRGAGVQEAIMSTANQYGANTDLILKALKDKDTSKMSDKDIINAIQDYKAETVKTRFKSSSAAVQAGVAKRIEQERAMLLGVEGGAALGKEGAAAKPSVEKPAEAKPAEAKPAEVKPKTDAQRARDWAWSIFSGKANMSQVPKPYLDEVGKILSAPPKHWSTAPAIPQTKIETAKITEGKPPAEIAVEEVKPKLEEKSIRNWAYSAFIGKATLGQVPAAYREKVAALLKNPPKEWSKAPSDVKPQAEAKSQEEKATNEEFEINGKKVSKEEFDQFMKDNPQVAQMMDMAKNLSSGQGMPGTDMLQKMGGMLPVGADIPSLASEVSGLDPSQMFTAPAEMITPDASVLEAAKATMTEQMTAAKEEEAQARKMLFESTGRTDVQSAATGRAGRGAGRDGAGLAQEGGADSIELLNSKLDQLIAINQNIANVNNDQLRVQRNLNFSGNVFNSP